MAKRPGPRKRVTDLLYWLLWFKMPAKDLEDLVHMADGEYSSTDKPVYQQAMKLANILIDGE